MASFRNVFEYSKGVFDKAYSLRVNEGAEAYAAKESEVEVWIKRAENFLDDLCNKFYDYRDKPDDELQKTLVSNFLLADGYMELAEKYGGNHANIKAILEDMRKACSVGAFGLPARVIYADLDKFNKKYITQISSSNYKEYFSLVRVYVNKLAEVKDEEMLPVMRREFDMLIDKIIGSCDSFDVGAGDHYMYIEE